LALKKYNYFCDALRTHYFISPENINMQDSEIVSEKTGVERTIIDSIFLLENSIRKSETISAEKLLEFNKLIEDFYEKRQ
jgi:hypothetical protein